MTKNNFSCFADLVSQLEFIGGFENEWYHRWECTEGTAYKFWELYHAEGADRDSIEIRWGRIGNKAQSVVKTWAEATKKAGEKFRKGYTDEGGWMGVHGLHDHRTPTSVCGACEITVLESDICEGSPSGDKRCGECCDCKVCCVLHDSLPAPFNQIARFGVAAGSNGTIHIAMNRNGSELLRMPHEAAAKFALEHLS